MLQADADISDEAVALRLRHDPCYQRITGDNLMVQRYSRFPKETCMPVFDYRFTIKAPLADVREFHHDTSALKRLTPPPTIVQLHEIEPLGEGSVSKFTLWVGPVPLRWTAVHRGISERGFTDVQVSGPALKWEHTHIFTQLSANVTEIQEHIEYEHKHGFSGFVTRILFARLNLNVMFAYRKWATRWHMRFRKSKNLDSIKQR